MEALRLVHLTGERLLEYTGTREGEVRIGEVAGTLGADTGYAGFSRELKQQRSEGKRFAVLGIPEDIGPRTNLGRGGADGAWEAFLSYFPGMQSNRFLGGEQFLFVGRIDLDDLQRMHRRSWALELREAVEEIDRRVAPVVRSIVDSGLIPIVIGGGHNNAYPIIKGVAQAYGRKAYAVNIDPHADFRRTEDGRHSGNPFSFAFGDEVLEGYLIEGLHEQANPEYVLRVIDDLRGIGPQKVNYTLFGREGIGDNKKAREFVRHVSQNGHPLGVELDLDSIANMPASAQTPTGISLEEARRAVSVYGSVRSACYLHLPEGAPGLRQDGRVTVGKTLAALVVDFCKARP